jgi:hypothetical protein
MRILLLMALCSLQLIGAVSFDNYKDGGYSGGGTHTLTIVASGTNLGCIVNVWYRSGSTGTPTCGGNSMTKLATMSPTVCAGAATIDTWAYFGPGLSAGTLTVSVTATVESLLEAITVNGARQTGQPDALAAYVTGTTSSDGFGIPITTSASGSLVVGTYCAGATSHSPTTNGTWIGDGDPSDGVSLSFWRSTSTVAPAGAFTLQGGASTAGYPAQGNAFSIAPLGSAGSTYRSNPSVIVVGP